MAEDQQSEINQWQWNTFGPVDVGMAVLRLQEEVDELRDLGSHEAAAGEVADVYIVLCAVANALGVNIRDEVDWKMQINRARRWGQGSDGMWRHMK